VHHHLVLPVISRGAPRYGTRETPINEDQNFFNPPITGHEGLGRGGWSAQRPGRFTPGKDPVPIVQEAVWAPGPVWMVAKNLAPTGIRSADRPTRSQSLYRLSYPAHGPRPINLACDSDFHVSHRGFQHAAKLRHDTDGFTFLLFKKGYIHQPLCAETLPAEWTRITAIAATEVQWNHFVQLRIALLSYHRFLIRHSLPYEFVLLLFRHLKSRIMSNNTTYKEDGE
jgi:hypothetical protein